MWRRNLTPSRDDAGTKPQSLKDALQQARVETAERNGVVVDLRDAEVARLELLNEALDPLFAEIAQGAELFSRGISRGDPARLWVDAIAHIAMDRHKRVYRFVQDTRFGRQVLAETAQIPEMVDAITNYVARRLIEREQALAEDSKPILQASAAELQGLARRKRRQVWPAFWFGVLVGAIAFAGVLWFIAARLQR
jgi:hypothetical protein